VYAGIVTDCPVGIANASDGTMWTVNSCGSPYFYNVTTGGTTTNFSPAGASSPTQIVVGKDGAFYAADGTNIDRWDGTTLTQIAEPNGATIASVASVPSDGATGAIWYVANLPPATTTTVYVGRWAIGAATAAEITSYNHTNNGGTLNGIVGAADGTVWFTDSLNVRIGRCKIASLTCVEYPNVGTLPGTAPDPQNILVGPDGSLWYTDLSGFLGHIIP
jgi:streptogramin lyase